MSRKQNFLDKVSASYNQLILFAMLFITSCILPPPVPDLTKVKVDGVEKFIPNELLDELPDFEPKKDDQEPSEESATDELEEDLKETFSWLAKISALGGIVLGTLGIVHKPFGKLGIGKWLGLVSLCSIGALYFIPYFPYIFGAAAFLLFVYLLWKLYKLAKEKVEVERLAEHLSLADREESKDIMKAHKSRAPRTSGRILTED